MEFTPGLFTTEAVTSKLKDRNAAKQSHAFNLQIIAAAHARLGDYVAAAQHAFETGNLAEGQALSLAITHAINTMSNAGHALGDAVDRELSAARAAA